LLTLTVAILFTNNGCIRNQKSDLSRYSQICQTRSIQSDGKKFFDVRFYHHDAHHYVGHYIP